MKQITLLKQCSSIQLGHLYEHIFYAHLDTYLRNEGFYQPLDYTIHAATYEGGVIYIELTIYAKELDNISINNIKDLPISFNDDYIDIAINQIVAEKELPAGYEPYDTLRTMLNGIHATRWCTADEFSLLDTKSLRRNYKGFYISEGAPIKSRKLITYITINGIFIKKNRQLLPLFRQVAGLVMQNFSLDLADSRGYFIVSSAYLMVGTSKVKSEFRVGSTEVDVQEDSQYCLDTIQGLRKDKAFERLVNDLQHTSYEKSWWKAPNIEANYEDMAIFIGSEGWKEIATIENVEALLQQMSIELRFGKQYIKIHAS